MSTPTKDSKTYTGEDLTAIAVAYRAKSEKRCARCNVTKETGSINEYVPELKSVNGILTCWPCEKNLMREGVAIILARRKHEKEREELVAQMNKLLISCGVGDTTPVAPTMVNTKKETPIESIPWRLNSGS